MTGPPWLRHVPALAGVALAAVLLAAQAPRTRAIDLVVVPPPVDLTGTGTVSLLRVRVANRTDGPLAVGFPVRHADEETLWTTRDGASAVTLPGGAARTLELTPREFDRVIPLGARFRVSAIAPAEDLAGHALAGPTRDYMWTTLWRVPGLALEGPARGAPAISRGPRAVPLGTIAPVCVDGRLALRMTVRPQPRGPLWASAEVRYRLDPRTAEALRGRGLDVRVRDPLPAVAVRGEPAAIETVEVLPPRGRPIAFVFARASAHAPADRLGRRVVVVPAEGAGWRTVHLRVDPHVRDLGWPSGAPLTLTFRLAASRLAPGAHAGTFGVMTPAGEPAACGR